MFKYLNVVFLFADHLVLNGGWDFPGRKPTKERCRCEERCGWWVRATRQSRHFINRATRLLRPVTAQTRASASQ